MNKVLTTIAKLNEQGGAMTTTPIKPHIQAEIDAGNIKASAARSGPLGLYTGEMFLTLTDAGREKLKVSNVDFSSGTTKSDKNDAGSPSAGK